MAYVATRRPELGQLGTMTVAEQRDEVSGAQISRQFHQNTPQVQVQRALERQDLAALTEALKNNPQLLNGNPTLAEQLRKNEFFQQNREQIASSLSTPDPSNRDMPVPLEVQALAARIGGLVPPEQGRAGVPRQDVAMQQRQSFQMPSGMG